MAWLSKAAKNFESRAKAPHNVLCPRRTHARLFCLCLKAPTTANRRVPCGRRRRASSTSSVHDGSGTTASRLSLCFLVASDGDNREGFRWRGPGFRWRVLHDIRIVLDVGLRRRVLHGIRALVLKAVAEPEHVGHFQRVEDSTARSTHPGDDDQDANKLCITRSFLRVPC